MGGVVLSDTFEDLQDPTGPSGAPITKGDGSYPPIEAEPVPDSDDPAASEIDEPAASGIAETTQTDRRHFRIASEASLRLAALAVVIVAIGAAAGFIGSQLMPKEYAARAEIVYRLTESQPNELLREDRRLTTQLVLLGSRVVLAPVADDHAITPESLAEHVSAKVIDNSEIIEVEVRDRTPEGARTLLTEVIDHYLALANKDWKDPVREYLEFQRGEVQRQRRAPDLPPAVGLDLARREQFVVSLIEPLRPEPTFSPQSVSGPPARPLTNPYSVPDPVSPTPLIATAAGGATAFLVAAFVVLLIARRRAAVVT